MASAIQSCLVFVYEKTDDPAIRSAQLAIKSVVFVESEHTGDFQTTSGLKRILENDGNEDDLIAFMSERMLPMDEIQALDLAKEILLNHPLVGYLTISNALQWRLQYSRVIKNAGSVEGVIRVL